MKNLLSLIARKVLAKKLPATQIGKLPTRKGSVVAMVLAKLLKGQKVNSIELAAEAQTSRLKDVVVSLRQQHGWGAIRSERIAMGTADGRVQSVAQYWLPSDALVGVDLVKIAAWTKAVDHERYVLRLNVKYAQRRAKACNARKSSVATTVKGK